MFNGFNVLTVWTFIVVDNVTLILSSAALFNGVVAGTKCYSCDRLPHQRDCDTIIECGDHEECYGERLVTVDGISYYKSGCRSKSACVAEISSSGLILGKRIITPCSKCCNSDYCNREICDTHVQSKLVRCLSCKYAMSTDFCFTSVQCGPDEVCYSQTVIHNHERRYRLGCTSKQHCGNHTTNEQQHSFQNEYCGQCCANENCNRELCSGSPSSNLQLLQPPPLSLCRDNYTVDCAHNIHHCSEVYFKYYQCPHTCGFCSGQTIDTDECSSTPCKNGATCLNGVNSYTCICTSGYNGPVCETDIDECSSSPCKNSATCLDGVNSYTCICPNGYNGSDCETDIDECKSSPCKNNGTCHDGIASYTCTCPDKFTGTYCETAIGHVCSGSRYFTWKNYCYYLSTELREWKTHKSSHSDPCIERNMRLAVIDSDQEHDAIWYNIRVVMKDIRTFWLGGKYNIDENRWYWTNHNQIPQNNHHWESKDEDNHDHPYCMAMDRTMWDHRRCSVPHIHLCKSVVVSPYAALSPKQPTLNSIHHCEGNNYFQYDGHCYYLSQAKHSHHDIDACTNHERQMELAVIDSDAEQLAVSHFIRNIHNEPNEVWLRGYYQNESKDRGYWRWRSGNPLKYDDHNWKDDPYHLRGCMVLVGDQWGIRNCGSHFRQLCERSTISVK